MRMGGNSLAQARGIPTESMRRDWTPRAAGSQARPILHICRARRRLLAKHSTTQDLCDHDDSFESIPSQCARLGHYRTRLLARRRSSRHDVYYCPHKQRIMCGCIGKLKPADSNPGMDWPATCSGWSSMGRLDPTARGIDTFKRTGDSP